MRADMHKVIVERPRHGSRYDLRRKGRTQPLDADDTTPRHGSMSRRRGHRTLNENLAPLRRWLEAQAGRPWNAVWSELCANLRPSSTVQQHVRDHVDDFVARQVELIDGVPHRFVWGHLLPLDRTYSVLWVCPRTGLLRKAPRRPRERRSVRDPGPPPRAVRRRFNGCWYELTLAPLDALEPGRTVIDVALARVIRTSFDLFGVDRRLRSALYGRNDVYATAMRPLTRAELRRHGLRNDSTQEQVRRRRRDA